MFDVRYNGLRLIPSKSAANELAEYRLMIEDCKEILEKGYLQRIRKKGTLEMWKDFGDKTYNVVVVKSFNYLYNEEVYLIIHIGAFTKKSKKSLGEKQ